MAVYPNWSRRQFQKLLMSWFESKDGYNLPVYFNGSENASYMRETKVRFFQRVQKQNKRLKWKTVNIFQFAL